MITRTAEIERLKSLVLRGAGAEQVSECGLDVIRALAEADDVTARLHPLGFLQVVLAAYKEFSLRLHIWSLPPIPPKEPDWRVHLHGWALRSYVLRGEAINLEYDVMPDPDGLSQLYEVSYDNGVSTLERTDQRVRCQERKGESYTAPTIYDVSPRVFHTTEGRPGVQTVTVAVVGVEKSGSPLVVGGVDGSETYARPMEMLNGEALSQRLIQLL